MYILNANIMMSQNYIDNNFVYFGFRFDIVDTNWLFCTRSGDANRRVRSISNNTQMGKWRKSASYIHDNNILYVLIVLCILRLYNFKKNDTVLSHILIRIYYLSNILKRGYQSFYIHVRQCKNCHVSLNEIIFFFVSKMYTLFYTHRI